MPESSSDVPQKTGAQAPECTEACSSCCGADQAARLAQIQGDIAMRNRALTLSSILVAMLFAAEIGFSFMGKTLNLPNIEIVWMVVCGSWFGSAGGKIAEIFLARRQ